MNLYTVVCVSTAWGGKGSWMLTKHIEKKLDSNYTRMLWAILNKSWRQHPTKQQLYDHLPPIMKIIKVRQARHAGHCWRSKDELISDILLWTPTHRQAKAGRPTRTYIQQLCADIGYSPEDLLEAMDDREGWQERLRDIHVDSATWWWWFFFIQTTSQTIKNLTNISKQTNNETTSHAGIYSIPRKDCNKHYIGKTQHNLGKKSTYTIS